MDWMTACVFCAIRWSLHCIFSVGAGRSLTSVWTQQRLRAHYSRWASLIVDKWQNVLATYIYIKILFCTTCLIRWEGYRFIMISIRIGMRRLFPKADPMEMPGGVVLVIIMQHPHGCTKYCFLSSHYIISYNRIIIVIDNTCLLITA